jgi:hypothetical protein
MKKKFYQFYVYCLLDPRKVEPFYIGKGQGKRCLHHILTASHSAEVADKIKKLREKGVDPTIRIIGVFETEAEAFVCEAMMLKYAEFDTLLNKQVPCSNIRAKNDWRYLRHLDQLNRSVKAKAKSKTAESKNSLTPLATSKVRQKIEVENPQADIQQSNEVRIIKKETSKQPKVKVGKSREITKALKRASREAMVEEMWLTSTFFKKHSLLSRYDNFDTKPKEGITFRKLRIFPLLDTKILSLSAQFLTEISTDAERIGNVQVFLFEKTRQILNTLEIGKRPTYIVNKAHSHSLDKTKIDILSVEDLIVKAKPIKNSVLCVVGNILRPKRCKRDNDFLLNFVTTLLNNVSTDASVINLIVPTVGLAEKLKSRFSSVCQCRIRRYEGIETFKIETKDPMTADERLQSRQEAVKRYVEKTRETNRSRLRDYRREYMREYRRKQREKTKSI